MNNSPRGSRRWVLLLLVGPYVGLLLPGLYANRDPKLGGIPFFIWYQFAWVLLGVAITGAVYVLTRGEGDA